MLIAFCKECLPEKVVIAFGMHRSDIDVPHDVHDEPPRRNGLFPIPARDVKNPDKGWDKIGVDGDDAQTKANIVAQYGDRFE